MVFLGPRVEPCDESDPLVFGRFHPSKGPVATSVQVPPRFPRPNTAPLCEVDAHFRHAVAGSSLRSPLPNMAPSRACDPPGVPRRRWLAGFGR